MIQPISTSEKLLYSTARIVGLNAEGQPFKTGTGFFYSFDNESKRVFVTNKHVIEGTVATQFVVHASLPNATKPTDNLPAVVPSSAWMSHPNPKIDLCAIPFGDAAAPNNLVPFIAAVPAEMVPTQQKLNDLGAVEDVLMVGYPNGLWDAANNFPLIRRGITASHPAIDFNVDGVPTTVVDVACFPGSSGSPVFIYNNGAVPDKHGNIGIGSRIMFLGVLYAGPVMQADGQIVPRNIPTAIVPIPQISLMINLGYVIKARELTALAEMVTSREVAPRTLSL